MLIVDLFLSFLATLSTVWPVVDGVAFWSSAVGLQWDAAVLQQLMGICMEFILRFAHKYLTLETVWMKILVQSTKSLHSFQSRLRYNRFSGRIWRKYQFSIFEFILCMLLLASVTNCSMLLVVILIAVDLVIPLIKVEL